MAFFFFLFSSAFTRRATGGHHFRVHGRVCVFFKRKPWDRPVVLLVALIAGPCKPHVHGTIKIIIIKMTSAVSCDVETLNVALRNVDPSVCVRMVIISRARKVWSYVRHRPRRRLLVIWCNRRGDRWLAGGRHTSQCDAIVLIYSSLFLASHLVATTIRKEI